MGAVMGAIYALPAPYPTARAVLRAHPGRDWVRHALAGSLVAASLGVLFSLVAARRETGPTLSCQANLRQLGRALAVYAQDYDDRLPPREEWSQAAASYGADLTRLRCPGDTAPAPSPSYGFAATLAGFSLNLLTRQTRTPLLYEAHAGRFARRHERRGNVWFADGHVSLVSSLNVP
jgi:prepilin-type processing-associated H-X9-DG protein